MNADSHPDATPSRPRFRWTLGRGLFLLAVSLPVMLGVTFFHDPALQPADDLLPAALPAIPPARNGWVFLMAEWKAIPWPFLREKGVADRIAEAATGEKPWDDSDADLAKAAALGDACLTQLIEALAYPEFRPPTPAEAPQDYESVRGSWVNDNLYRGIMFMRARVLRDIASQDGEAVFAALEAWTAFSAKVTRHAPSLDHYFFGMAPGRSALSLVPALLPAPGSPDFDGRCDRLLRLCRQSWITRDAISWCARQQALTDGYRALTYDFAAVMAPDSWRRKYLFRRQRTVNDLHAHLRVVDRMWLEPPVGGVTIDRIYREWSDAAARYSLHPNAEGRTYAGVVMGKWSALDFRSRTVLFLQRAMTVRLALHRWQRLHPGMVPPLLAGLVPDFLSEIPADPWDGRPLRWTTAVPGGMVYSIGLDLKDDPMESFDHMTEPHRYVDGHADHPAVRLVLPP